MDLLKQAIENQKVKCDNGFEELLEVASICGFGQQPWSKILNDEANRDFDNFEKVAREIYSK